MRVAVIGAGVSGLSLARLLQKHGVDFEVFEEKSRPGGIAHVENIEDIPFHLTGGHCFNSHHKKVRDFVFNEVLPIENWNLLFRNAKVYLNGRFYNYPIEYSLKEIFLREPLQGFSLLFSLLLAKKSTGDDLESWFRAQFGNHLAELYFIPYTRKIFGLHPSELACDWVHGKLPCTKKSDVLLSFFGKMERKMPHHQFYYPKQGRNAFVKALARNVPITHDAKIESITHLNMRWIVGGKNFSHLIFTGPLNELADIYTNCDDQIKSATRKLRFNRITTTLWRSDPINHLWSYHPDPATPFHRHVHIGNFLEHRRPEFTIAECLGMLPANEAISAARKVPYLHELIGHHTSEHAYVIFDKAYNSLLPQIKEYYRSEGIVLMGRFAEWDYYNMDICISRAMEVFNNIVKDPEVL